MKILPERLRALREKLNISQAKLAEEIGVSQVSVNRYETGKITPPAETLLWYADRFDVSLDYIFGRTEKPQGKIYEYKPKPPKYDPRMKEFVEMCFDPKSPISGRLKETILKMLEDNKEDEK